jgi:hypothetical protein
MGAAGRVKGRPELTRRDAQAMAWIGEQYGARMDAAAVLLGRLSPVAGHPGGPLSRRSMRVQLDRWDRARLAVVTPMLGAQWVVPTEQGLRYGGLDYDRWQPRGNRLEHAHSVALVRLWAEAHGATWTGERELRRRRHVTRRDNPALGGWHCPDGVVVDQAGLRLLVEVELTLHGDRKVSSALDRPAPDTDGVVYFTRPDMVEVVRAQLARVWPELATHRRKRPWDVRPLPDVPGASYDGGW